MRSTLALKALFAAALTLALTSTAGNAQANKLPSNATAVDVTQTETSGSVDVLHTIVLKKWRKGRILHIDVMLEVKDSGGNVIALLQNIAVNGFIMNVFAQERFPLCSGTDDCTVIASAWLDLDEAAASDPGAFKGQPLVIEISGRSEGAGSTDTRRLRALAQLIKK
jgi:hypothetical protein